MDFMDAFHQAGILAKLTFLVAFGPLALALTYVLRPADRTLALMRPVSLSAIFAGVCGLAAGLIAVLMGIAATPTALHERNVYIGLAEALVPALINFGLLAVAWILVAAGMTRRPRVE